MKIRSKTLKSIKITEFKSLILLLSLLLGHSCVGSTQNSCGNNSIIKEIKTTSEKDGDETVFYYFNNEWIAIPDLNMVSTDSIQNIETKNDRYGNRAIFVTVSPETLEKLKSEVEKLNIDISPICEFTGGNRELYQWIEDNIRVPEGFKGQDKVIVQFYIQPDGSITDPQILRSKSNITHAEAFRLVNSLPKFQVKYRTPNKFQFAYTLPITFYEPGKTFINGSEASFIHQFPKIKAKIKRLYTNIVFETAKNPDFKISDICTADFLKRLELANDTDSKGYATWLLRSGAQDGDDSQSTVTNIVPGADNTAVVSWIDMGHRGRTTLTLIEVDGEWKINDTTIPDGNNLSGEIML